MARNLSTNLKRIVAGLCAVLVVAGAVPVQPVADIFSETVITASAATTYSSGTEIGYECTLKYNDLKVGDIIQAGVKFKNSGYNVNYNPVTDGYYLIVDGVYKLYYTQDGGETYTTDHMYIVTDVTPANTSMYNYTRGHITLSSPKAEVTSAPVANTLTYTGSDQALVTNGTASNGTMKYKLGDGSWQDTVPTATSAGPYTVYYKAAGGTYGGTTYSDSSEGSVEVTISKASNPLTFSNQNVSKSFSTSAQTATLAAATKGEGTVTYSITSGNDSAYFLLNGTTLTIKANTPAGTYTLGVSASAAGNDNYEEGTKDSMVTVTIERADSSVTTAPAANTLTYNGSAQQLLQSGASVTGGGTVHYKLSTDTNWETDYTKLKGTDAKEYTVQYYADESDNYKAAGSASNPKSMTVTIGRKSISDATVNVSVPTETYTGSAIEPSVTVTDSARNNVILGSNDYSITKWEKNINAGTNTASVTIEGTGNYSGTRTEKFSINKATYTTGVTIADWTYGDTANTPSVTSNPENGAVTYTYQGTGSTAYDASITPPTKAGTYQVTASIAETANYNTASATADFTIKKAANAITKNPTGRPGLTYNGADQTLIESNAESTAEHDTIYYLATTTNEKPGENAEGWNTSAPKMTNAGTYYVWTKSANDPNFETAISATATKVEIAKKDLAGALVILNRSNVPNSDVKPYVLAVVVGTLVATNDDLNTLEYTYDANLAKVIVTAKSDSNFKGTASADFNVGTDIRLSEVEMETSFDYTAKEIKPVVKLTYDGTDLVKDTDYTVSYSDNIQAGTGKVTITGKGTYAGVIEKTFTINKKNINDVTVAPIADQTFDNTEKTPALTLTNGDMPMTYKADKTGDYFTYYSANIEPGEATVVITGENNYTGSREVTFRVVGDLTKSDTNDFTSASVTKTIPLESNNMISTASFTGANADNLSVSFHGKKLTLGTDYTVKSVSFTDGAKSGTVTIQGKGYYKGERKLDFAVQNYTQTLTVNTDISAQVVVAGLTNASEYVLEVGKTYAITNNSTYILTLTGTTDITINKGATYRLYVEDEVNYTLRVHTHRDSVKNENGKLVVTCADGDSDNETLAEIKNNEINYGDETKPAIYINPSYASKVTSQELTVKDSNNNIVALDNLKISDVGTYTAYATIVYNGATYSFEKPFTISPKPIVLTPTAGQNKIYGNDEPDRYEYTLADNALIEKDKDNVTFYDNFTRAEGENVGNYNYVLKGENNPSELVVGNYKISLASGNQFEIKHREITVTPEAKSKTYGENDPAFSCTTEDSVALSENQDFSQYIGRVSGEDVQNGGYAYTITATDGIVGNYKISIAGNTKFTINPKSIDDLLTFDGDKTYTGDALTFNAAGTYNSQKLGDLTLASGMDFDITDNVQTNVKRDSQTDEVLTYTATVTGKGNYTGSKTFEYKVLPKSIAENDIIPSLNYTSFNYNTQNQVPELTVKDTRNNTDLVADRDYTSDIQAQTNANSSAQPYYTINITGKGNYTGNTSMNWSINKINNTGSITVNDKTYDGKPIEPVENLAEALPEGISVQYTYYQKNDDNTTWTQLTEAPINVGSYKVIATIPESGNYNQIVLNEIEFKINPQPVTVTPKAGQSKVYGTTDPESFDYEVEGLVEGETLSGSLKREAGDNVGNYAFTLGDLATNDNNKNYNVSFAAGTLPKFEIKAAEVTVTPTVITKVFGDAEPALGYTAVGLIGSDSLTGTISRATGEDVDEYAFDISGLTATTSNYTVRLAEGNDKFTITAKPITITEYTISVDETTGQLKAVVNGNEDITNTVDTENNKITLTGNYSGEKSDALTHHAKVDASCTETGTVEYWHSNGSDGKDYVKGSDGKFTEATDLTIARTAHTAVTAVRENYVSATYDRAGGYDMVRYCTVCGEELSRTHYTIPKLTRTSINSAEVTVTPESYEYDGTEKTPVITVKLSGKTLTAGTDYTVSGDVTKTDAGEYTVTVTGKGAYEGSTTASWSITAPAITPLVIKAKNAYFDGQLSLVLKYEIPEEITSDEKAYVEYTWLEGSTVRTERKLISSLNKGQVKGEEVYLVESPVYAPEMENKVTYKFYTGKGELITMTNSVGTETYDDGFKFSLRDYLELASENSSDKMKALAVAADDYGIAAQINFKYGDYEGLTVSNAVKNVKLSDLAAYESVNSGTLPEIIKNVVMSVEFSLDNTLRVKFNFKSVPTQEELNSLTCTIDGKTAQLEKLGEKQYALVVRNIASPQIDTVHTFTISDGTNTYTTKRSALSYAYSVVKSSSSQTLVDLAKAFYLYNQAANAYFNE